MRLFFLILLISSIQQINLSGQTYELISEQGETYAPLESFTSITLEKGLNTGNFRRWEHEFKFGFDFPFFDTTYNSFILTESGFGKFSDNADYNLFLFSGDYLAFNPADTPLVSEVRYQYDFIENEKVLKIEWHFVGLGWEVENETNLNHFLHYQVWLRENGSIEFHFGNIYLDESKLYKKGKGILNLQTQEVIGPYIKLRGNSPNQSIAITGTYDNLHFTKDPNGGIITTMPEWNWMIKLKYKLVGNEDIKENKIAIFPTSTQDIINISSPSKILDIRIFNLAGQELIQSNQQTVSLNHLNNGIYLVSVKTEAGIYSTKVIKN